MNPIPLGIAVVLLIMAQFRHRVFLIAIAASIVIGFPAFQPLGTRSALHVREIVIFGGLAVWWTRGFRRERQGLGTTMGGHFAAIIILAASATALGWLWFHSFTDVLIRPLMAVFRLGAVALAFFIPASYPLEERELRPAVRAVFWCMVAFLVAAVLERLGIVALGTYRLYDYETMRSGEEMAEAGMALAAGLGGFNRASTGIIAQLGLFVSLFALRIRCMSWYVGVPVMLGFVWLLLASFSRTSFVSLCVFGLALLLLHRRNRGRNLILVIFGVIGVAFVVTQSEAIR